ncbi:MAG: phosphoglycerate kinase, partial [SAR86 cluster bacterium]|nr:phosphoglycerate kinase [SAR86 cluster bacterium]
PRKVMVATSTTDENVEVVDFDSVPQTKMILDIEFNEEEFSSNTSEIIIWNGPLGIFEIDAFSKGTDSLVSYLSTTKSKVIAGGGETIFAITKFSSIDNFNYVSTAGGAFLEFLGGRELPSIQALN